METQTLITLDVLASRGILDAIEICNEIEAIMEEQSRTQTDEMRVNKLFEIVIRHVPEYFEHSYQKAHYTKYGKVQTTRKAIASHSRIRELVECRAIMYALLRKYTRLSLKSIGAKFSGRDHSTTCHGLNLCRDLIQTDRRFRMLYDAIEKDFKNYLK